MGEKLNDKRKIKLKSVRMNKSSLLLILFFSLLMVSCDKNIEFNSLEWKEWKSSPDSPNLRWLMHKSLLSEHQLVGMSQDSITELLGEPDRILLSKWHYYLGYTGWSIEEGALLITWDGYMVKEYEIAEG